MMRFTIYLFILLRFGGILNAQELSPEEETFIRQCDEVLENKIADTLKYQALIANLDIIKMIPSELSKPYLKKGVEIAHKNKDLIWRGQLNLEIGKVFSSFNQKDSAEILYNLALGDFQKAKSIENELKAHNVLSRAYAGNDSADKSLEHAYIAIAICEKTNNQIGLAQANLNICRNLTNFDEPEAAAEFARKALQIYQKNDHRIGQVTAYDHLSCCYTFSQPKLALTFIDSAIHIINEERILDVEILSKAYFAKTRALTELMRYAEVETNLLKLDSLTNGRKDFFLIHSINYSIGLNAFLKQKKYAEAKKIFYQEVNHPYANKNPLTAYNLYHLSKSYAGLGQLDSAYICLQKSTELENKNKYQASKLNMQSLKTKYETEKKEAIILVQKEKLAQQKTIQLLTIGLVGILSLFFFQVLQSVKKRKIVNENLEKTNKLLAHKNEQNELLLKEIHHRVKNNLETVASLLALQTATIKDSNVLEAMQASQSRVMSMSLIHQKLYQGEKLATIEMKDYFINLSESILDSLAATNQIQIECAMEDVDLEVDLAIPVGLIVNELLTNSIRHAFPNNQKGRIKISLKEEKNNYLKLTISDNGIGKDNRSNEKNKNFGSQLIQLLTNEIDGKIHETIKEGTIISLEFKKA